MPDDNNTLESLISAAEQDEQAPLQQNNPVEKLSQTVTESLRDLPAMDASTCDHTGTFPHQRTFCRQCKKLICPRCCSSLDSLYCVACLAQVDVAAKPEQVTDDDGINHTLNHISVTPAYNTIRWIPDSKTTAKALSDMNESELYDFIQAYKDAVREAERALDFRRIRLGSAQLELDERREQTRRRLRADKTKFPVKTVTVDKSGKKVTKTASPTAMLDMIKALQQLQALKKAKQTPPTSSDNGGQSNG